VYNYPYSWAAWELAGTCLDYHNRENTQTALQWLFLNVFCLRCAETGVELEILRLEWQIRLVAEWHQDEMARLIAEAIKVGKMCRVTQNDQ